MEVLPLVGEYVTTGAPILRLHAAKREPPGRDAERAFPDAEEAATARLPDRLGLGGRHLG